MAYKRSSMMEARLAHNRRRIIRSARKIIATEGFKGAQVSAIAEKSNISTGLIYRYFSSKSQLLIEILNDAVQHEIDLIQAIGRRNDYSARDNLLQAVQSFVSRAIAGPMLAYAFIAEPVDTQVEAERLRCKARFSDALATILQQGVENGEFMLDDVGITATCIVGMMTEAVISPIAPDAVRPYRKEKVLENILNFCLNGISQMQPLDG